MPSVDIAMAQSLRGGAWQAMRDSVIRSVVTDLQRRNVVDDAENKVTDVKTAFSSWDNCMKAVYCKWPVIAIIIIGSLILISIVWCIIRCCCCGLSCCCGCFRFLQCCGNCCGCCDSPKGTPHKHLDDQFGPAQNGYRQQAPMHPGFPQVAPMPVATTAHAGPPQYAEFDAPKRGGEDALPQMPSWDTANSKKVAVEEEEVEMSNLRKNPASQQVPPRGVASPSSGLSTPRPMVSPLNSPNPYGPQRNDSDYMSTQSHRQPGHYSPLDQAYNNTPQRDSDGYGLDQPYDAPAGVGLPGAVLPAAVGYGQQPHSSSYNGQAQNHAYEVPAPMGAMPHGRQSPALDYNGQPRAGPYGAAPVPAPMGAMALGRESPAPSHSGYGQGQTNPGYAEMPAEPVAVGTPTHAVELAQPAAPAELGGADYFGQAPQSPSKRGPGNAPMGYGMQRQGTGENSPSGYGMRRQGTGDAPEGYGMRRAGTGDNAAAMGSRAPYGMDPRMRNSPGPRRTPGPQGDQPFAQGPRGSPAPRNENGYGPAGPNSPREAMNRTYSPASGGPPNRMYSPAPGGPPNRTYSPAPGAPNRTFSPSSPGPSTKIYAPAPERPMAPQGSHPLRRPGPEKPFAQAESPTSPITNNSGFDFVSGFSRPPNQAEGSPSEPQAPVNQDAYPGHKPYRG